MMRWFHSLSLATVLTLGAAFPGIAADFIVLPLGRNPVKISVNSLETYAKGGQLNQDDPLFPYLKLLNPQQEQSLRDILQSRYSPQGVSIDQFLNSPLVTGLLINLGKLLQTQSGDNGASAIQMAIVQAANTSDTFTLLDIIRQFPSPEIRVNLEKAVGTMAELLTLVQQTESAFNHLEELSKLEAATTTPVNFNQMQDLRKQGNLNVSKQTISVPSSQSNGSFEVDVYLPEPQSNQFSYPVLVISHGLASNRSRFENLAKHLTSYGFVVAVPQHLGSDYQHFQALINGNTENLLEPEEFLNRPRDITQLLNELELLNDRLFNNQLNLENVGIIGHSLGGYTALTLGGATLNFTQLKTDCEQEEIPLNPSLFLQCLVLKIPEANYNLQDPRVKGILVLNPLNSSVLGESGLSQIQVPVMMVTSSADFLTPAVLEQIKSFTWLTTPHKYLVVQNRANHFFDIRDKNNLEQSVISSLVSPSSEINHRYIRALSVAFFKTYLTKESQYKPYLNAAYTQTISDPTYPLSLVQSLTPDQFTEVVKRRIFP